MIVTKIVTVKTSVLDNSTGGGIGKTIEQNSDKSVFFSFDESESFFASRKYKFFYLVNTAKTDFIVSKIKLSLSLNYLPVQDKFNIIFGGNLNFNVFITSFFQKNTYHLSYTQYGEILEYKKNVEDYIIEESKELMLKTDLNFSEFFPFGIYVEAKNSLERIINLPLVLTTKVFLL